MKRVFAFMLSLILAMSLVTTAFAERSTSANVGMEASVSQVDVDGTFTVTIKAAAAITGFRTMSFHLNYDSAKVSATTIEGKKVQIGTTQMDIPIYGLIDVPIYNEPDTNNHNESDTNDQGTYVGYVFEFKDAFDLPAMDLLTVTFKGVAAGDAKFSVSDLAISTAEPGGASSGISVTSPADVTVTVKSTAPACEHKMEATQAKEATCVPGNSAYWYCTVCEKYFSDDAGTTEIEKDSWILTPTMEHDFSDIVSETGEAGDSNPTHQVKCSRCGTIQTPETPHAGADDYINDAEKGQHYQECGCGVKVYSDHTGGTATCTSKKVCSKCGEPYGDVDIVNGHVWDTKYTVDTAATCYEKGSESIHCTLCSATKEARDIIKIDHTPSQWKMDETYHWKDCTVQACGATVVAKSNHVDDNKDNKCDVCDANMTPAACSHNWVPGDVIKASTCTDLGTRKITCSICGEESTEAIPCNPDAHNWDMDNWTSDGTNHWHTCKNGCSEKNGEASCSGRNAATCQVKSVCETCGQPYGGFGVHDWDNEHWDFDGNSHWHACKTDGCTAKSEEAIHADSDDNKLCDTCDYDMSCKHTWNEGEVTTKATCKDKGVLTKTCTKCSETTTEEINIDPTNHTSETKLVGKVDATCTTKGYTGDTYCAGCNTMLTLGTETDMLAHTWDQGSVTKKPTCTEVGVLTKHCTMCKDATTTEPIPATGHSQKTEMKGAVEPTCAESGKTDDTYCTACGEKIADGEVIPATGRHTWGEWETTKEPTCTKAGEEQHKCSVCDKIETRTIPATSHDYGRDGKCTKCGARKPGGTTPSTPTTPTTPTTGKDAKSPTTGDAGIMLYAGMSVMSLMGMGWVAKKRHD